MIFPDKLILINGTNEILQLSDEPLAPFADEDTVDSTVTTSIPDIYPIFPTIDLTEEHIYRLQNNTGVYPSLLWLIFNINNIDDW